MKILITGASGLVGSRICALWQSQKKWQLLTPDISSFSLTDGDSIQKFFQHETPDVVVHLAAFTDVTKAENQRGDKFASAWKLNVEGTEYIAAECRKRKSALIYISTDMVFTGNDDNKGPYKEDTSPETTADAISWYGFTKAEGERLVTKFLPDKQRVIIRFSSPVRSDRYDQKPDYVQKILQAYEENRLPPLFADQYFTLTYIDEVAHALYNIITHKYSGIFHISSRNVCTPFELGTYLLLKRYGQRDVIKKGSLTQYRLDPANARRYTQYGGLQVEKTQSMLNMRFNTWEETVDRIVAEYDK